ncbi:NAD(P)/FAD-dependent oxidoreductase [Bacillus sp. 31A1R]|uniref:NAD(P)/FAD-dependent oxidoreductase n=1 Tax=Robertmurraya mangrovi TaxID=3098077 RepID=A0ABU5J3C5_9BACI|nr:NAD(P)/FAD-dependent oxidoreductase [Bacillus sp. 31A1R]MDZ5473903.1 NAD(P)/FAD-dependent oxidoreductase [Bacillus sp. 31A1R]
MNINSHTKQLTLGNEVFQGGELYMKEKKYDVIVIGGGFSGITAARELRLLGHNVLVLEARDRIGGRTWVDKRLDSELEMGGTYVHWHQPYVWTEITRYDLELTTGPKAEKVYWITNNKTYSSTVPEFRQKLRGPIEKLMKESNKNMPLPFQPLSSPDMKDLDKLTADEFLKQFNLTQEEYDIIHGWVASDFCGSPAEGALTQIFRWWVFSQGNWDTHSAMISSFRIKKGTKALIEAMASDADADLKLSTVVKKVEQQNNQVIVTTQKGKTYTGKAVIVTVPLTTLKDVEFSPPLSKEKQASSKEGQTSKGVKVWAKLKGKLEPFDALAHGDYPLNSVHLDRYVGEDSIIVGFGADVKKLDPNNREDVEKALKYWLPDVEVLECTGHDWVNDEFTKETWPMLKPNQLTSFQEAWNTPENAVFLAGSTYANGWAGFIDGAIESGIKTGRRVHHFLTGNTTLKKEFLLQNKNIIKN